MLQWWRFTKGFIDELIDPPPAEARRRSRKQLPLVNHNEVLTVAREQAPSRQLAVDLVYLLKERKEGRRKRQILPMIQRLVESGQLRKVELGGGLQRWEVRDEHASVHDDEQHQGNCPAP